MAGLGGALLFYPVTTITPEYFKTRRATASGIQQMGGPFIPTHQPLLTFEQDQAQAVSFSPP